MLVLECFISILIPACMHFTIRVKYKQPAIMKILVPLNALLHIPHLGLRASDHFMTSHRPWQVRACCYFSKKNCAYGDLGTSLFHILKLDPSREQSASELQPFPSSADERLVAQPSFAHCLQKLV